MPRRWPGGKTKKTVRRAAPRRGSRDLLDTAADVQTSYFFMLNCLLHSRVHTGLESNSEFYDEDVNVYLAHLLNAHIDPARAAHAAEWIAPDDATVHRMIADAPDDRQRYQIYKANADFLLVAVTIFDVFEDRHYNRHPAFHIPRESHIGRAALYYSLAASHAARLSSGPASLAPTLAKISEGIETYVRILAYLRGHYLDLIRRYSVGELFHLERSIQEIERGETIEQMRNEFLDTYHAWLKTGVSDLKEKLSEQARMLKEIDPSFNFKPPR
jgi:hypothetical protein